MSPTDSPRAYSARILSSNPAKRRWRFLTSLGSKLLSRSRGVRIATGPCSLTSVFGVEPLRVFPAPRRLQMRLVTEMVGQLDLYRPLQQTLGQLRQNAPGATISSSVFEPASSSSTTSQDRRSRVHGQPLDEPRRGAPAARLTARRRRPPG